jgi:hypothetical protein
MVNKEENCEQDWQRLWVLFLPPVEKALGNFNEENVTIPSVTVISKVYLSSVRVLYTTALEKDYAITVSVNIHAMAFQTFHRQRSRLQDRWEAT